MTPTLFPVSYAGLWDQDKLDLEAFIEKAAMRNVRAKYELSLALNDPAPLHLTARTAGRRVIFGQAGRKP